MQVVRCSLLTLPSVHHRRSFSTIQRGHDKQVESLYEKLGFGKDKDSDRVRRSIKELEQGFVRQVQLLRDPIHDPKDAARLEELKEAYVLLRDENFRRNYTAHFYNSNDAQLHVLVDGGSVAANFNPEHQSFEFVDHHMLRKDGGHTENESLSSGAPSSASFANTQEAYRNATGAGAMNAQTATAYSASAAHGPVHGTDIPFLLKLSFEESLLGCSRQLRIQKHTQCQQCKGNGTQTQGKSASRRRCPQCLGRGSLHLPSATYHIERKCNYCGGEGTMPPPRCTRCQGRGVLLSQPSIVSVVVPPGSFSGATFRLHHKGHDGVRGGRAGDLVITILATEHRHFHRVGSDLHAMLPLPLSTALLGGIVSVPTLSAAGSGARGEARRQPDGSMAALRVPPCARNGQILGLRQNAVRSGSEGISNTTDDLAGAALDNIYYHVLVLVPKAESLSGRQKAALAAYEAATAAAAGDSGTDPSASHVQDMAPLSDWATDVSEAASAVRREHCATLKSQYKHWFAQ